VRRESGRILLFLDVGKCGIGIVFVCVVVVVGVIVAVIGVVGVVVVVLLVVLDDPGRRVVGVCARSADDSRLDRVVPVSGVVYLGAVGVLSSVGARLGCNEVVGLFELPYLVEGVERYGVG
jgi:hypothetical protein